jgi:hypothetical protein
LEVDVKRTQTEFNAPAVIHGELPRQIIANEQGVALIFALVIMVVLAIIGASALMTSEVDLKVSGTTKVLRQAFYLADGGIEMSPKILATIIRDRTLPPFAETPAVLYDGVDYDDPSNPSDYVTDASQTVTLVDKVLGYESSDDPSNDVSDITMDRGSQGSIAVDVIRVGTVYISGGGTEFASGTEGVGVGGAASTAVIYDFVSTGSTGGGQSATDTQIAARYRKVMGVSGGK